MVPSQAARRPGPWFASALTLRSVGMTSSGFRIVSDWPALPNRKLSAVISPQTANARKLPRIAIWSSEKMPFSSIAAALTAKWFCHQVPGRLADFRLRHRQNLRLSSANPTRPLHPGSISPQGSTQDLLDHPAIFSIYGAADLLSSPVREPRETLTLTCPATANFRLLSSRRPNQHRRCADFSSVGKCPEKSSRGCWYAGFSPRAPIFRKSGPLHSPDQAEWIQPVSVVSLPNRNVSGYRCPAIPSHLTARVK